MEFAIYVRDNLLASGAWGFTMSKGMAEKFAALGIM